MFASHVDTLHIDDKIVCLKIVSVYKLKRVGDATHPCLTRRCIRISSDKSFVILTDAVFSQLSMSIRCNEEPCTQDSPSVGSN